MKTTHGRQLELKQAAAVTAIHATAPEPGTETALCGASTSFEPGAPVPETLLSSRVTCSACKRLLAGEPRDGRAQLHELEQLAENTKQLFESLAFRTNLGDLEALHALQARTGAPALQRRTKQLEACLEGLIDNAKAFVFELQLLHGLNHGAGLSRSAA